MAPFDKLPNATISPTEGSEDDRIADGRRLNELQPVQLVRSFLKRINVVSGAINPADAYSNVPTELLNVYSMPSALDAGTSVAMAMSAIHR